jgi:hypothetical protein
MIAWFLDISSHLAVLLSLKSESARGRDESKPSAIEQQNFEMQREYFWNLEVLSRVGSAMLKQMVSLNTRRII